MKTNTTQWTDIPGYKGFYQVSTTGRVRNTRTLRTLSVQRAKTPAARVRLSKKGVERSMRITTLLEVIKHSRRSR